MWTESYEFTFQRKIFGPIYFSFFPKIIRFNNGVLNSKSLFKNIFFYLLKFYFIYLLVLSSKSKANNVFFIHYIILKIQEI